MKGWKTLAATAALAIVAAACGSDTPTAPASQAKSLDVNGLIDQMSVGDPSRNVGAQSAFSLPTTLGLSHDSASACSYDATSQGFACAPVDIAGVHYALTYWLYDSDGHALQTADASRTASIRTVTDVTGTLNVPSTGSGESIGVTTHGDMTLSGLLAATRMLNGTSTSQYDVHFDGSTAVHTVIDDTSHTTNVAIPATATDGGYWPSAGTIAGDSHVVTTSGAFPPISIQSHAVLTFLGGGKMQVQMTIGGTTSTCTIDLASKLPTSCVS